MRRFASTLLTACLVLQAARLVSGEDDALLRRRLQESQHGGSSSSLLGQVSRQGSSSKQQQMLTQPKRSATNQLEMQATRSGSSHSEKGAASLDRSTNLMTPQKLQQEYQKGSTGSLTHSSQRLPSTTQEASSETANGQLSRLQQGEKGSFSVQQQQQHTVDPEQMSSQEMPTGLRGSSQSGFQGKNENMRSPSAIETRSSENEEALVSGTSRVSSSIQQPIEQQKQALPTVSSRTSGSRTAGSTGANTFESNTGGRAVDQSLSLGEMQSDMMPHSQSNGGNQGVSNNMQGMQRASPETSAHMIQTRAKNEMVGDTSMDESRTTMLTASVSTVASRFSSSYPDRVEGYVAGATRSKTGPITSNSGSSLLETPSSSTATQSSSSISEPKHGKFNTQEEAAECNPLEPQKKQVIPAWLSSFPGSGSRIAWKLIEAVTGLYTSDDLDSAGRVESGVAVVVKTHYPSHTDARLFNQGKFSGISNSVLLLRNPMHAIPALYRFIYFVEEKHERTSASAAPPANAWVAWRNQYFDRELQLWLEHTQWWLENYSRKNIHLVPFESLSSPERGSDELQKLGNFLGSADPNIAASLLAPDKFCCVWEKLVSQDEFDTSSEKTPPYTADQLEAIIQGLIALRDSNKSFPEFFTLMNEYLGEIVETKKEIIAMSKNTRDTQL